MALFRPYERTDSSTKTDRISSLTPKGEKAAAKTEKAAATTPVSAEPATAPETAATATPAGPKKKQGPTPKRKDAEAARMERLHPSLTRKQQRKADSVAKQKARLDSWERTERAPERQLLRDFVDTRWTVAEFMLPAMILIMVAVMLTMNNVVLSSWISMSLWVLMFITIINIGFMWRGFKRLMAERHPGVPLKGLLMYMFNRSLMIRRFRQPGPRINRGDTI